MFIEENGKFRGKFLVFYRKYLEKLIIFYNI